MSPTTRRLAAASIMLAGCADPEVEISGEVTGLPSGVQTSVTIEELIDGEREEIDIITVGNGPFEHVVVVSDTPTRLHLWGAWGNLADGCDGDEVKGGAWIEVDDDGHASPVTLAFGAACTPPPPPSTSRSVDDSPGLFGCAFAGPPRGGSWIALPLVIFLARRRLSAVA
jgi:hypothetical protein